ncbi:unnamed protein product [Spirodela intermedia]|uniref:Uncharacterized protein n=2 Tax=Spirodela intermedia TaxID=51605 RepID=A0A7I8IGF9_SPIIN|nr:unnamed protein product [Spirodela intermedia]CAA6655952.1 unnamed protein product [Spirodela intermedia]CAA7391352.1 unnamed protein product [Spirodela intermedia]
MNKNTTCLLIGLLGAGITMSAYSQTIISSTQCTLLGFVVLLFGLLFKEGLFDSR